MSLFVDMEVAVARYFAQSALVLSFLTGTSFAQVPLDAGQLSPGISQCQVPIGTVITLVDPEVLLSSLGTGGQPRGEFETTEAYEARMAASNAAPTGAFVSIPLNTKYITYDADAGAFKIESYAVDNTNASWEAVNKLGQLPWTISGSPSYIDLVLKSDEVVTGTYTASNAYGASTTVRQIARTTLGILERPAEGSEDLFLPNRPWDPSDTHLIANVSVAAAQAPAWRSTLRAAAFIQPKAPLVVRGTKDWGSANMERPKEVTETLTAIIADIRCVVLTDQKNRVLASIPTR